MTLHERKEDETRRIAIQQAISMAMLADFARYENAARLGAGRVSHALRVTCCSIERALDPPAYASSETRAGVSSA